MPPTGELGFEGLIATLLSALTGYRFYVARSGDQPADAVSSEGDIAIQGKRYDKARIGETEFEGAFQKACRVCPKLDCYVLAATRTTAQLTTLADRLQSFSAVDILLVGFGNADSELPALCLSFWEKVRHFPQLSQLDATFAQWAAAEAARPAVRATLDQLRASLTRSVPLAATVRRQLKAYLDVRFQINSSSGRPSRFPIDLPHSVARLEPRRQLVEWWKDGKTRAAVINAEEGMGKSWVAADCAMHLMEGDKALVLWLDSADWAGLRTIEEVVDAGLKQAGFGEPSELKRLARKALTRWVDRFLVILDGVNERGARDTAQRLLAQLHAAQVAPCRLVFTTRPITFASDERRLWNAATPVPLGRFTEMELKDALVGLAPPIPRHELPSGLVEVATIPRYFRTAVALRTRFKTLANVSKEMVLWADLLAKVEAGDPQVTTQIGWTSPADVKRALLKLASAARAIQTNDRGTTDSYSFLQSCFGEKFEQIRFDLAEQRVVLEPSSENPAPSPEHVILGFALHLGSLAGKHPADSVSELADRLRKELEPVFSQDQLTEALFVALQLSAFPSAEGHPLSSRARTALLLAWASSQNSSVEAPRLRFWANQDMIAYLDFVEEVFIEPVSDGWSDVIVAPLLDLWRTSASKASSLDARLHRWLKLIWKSHDFPASPEFCVGGHTLPTARSRQQLTLSFVALAVLSEMPTELFLADLAIAWATASMSTERHSWPKQPGGDVVEVHDFHARSSITIWEPCFGGATQKRSNRTLSYSVLRIAQMS
jgi:hypothetical protein